MQVPPLPGIILGLPQVQIPSPPWFLELATLPLPALPTLVGCPHHHSFSVPCLTSSTRGCPAWGVTLVFMLPPLHQAWGFTPVNPVLRRLRQRRSGVRSQADLPESLPQKQNKTKKNLPVSLFHSWSPASRRVPLGYPPALHT